jgi:hypothetical protein
MISNEPSLDLALDLGLEVAFEPMKFPPLSTQRTPRAEIFFDCKKKYTITVLSVLLQPPMNFTSFEKSSIARWIFFTPQQEEFWNSHSHRLIFPSPHRPPNKGKGEGAIRLHPFPKWKQFIYILTGVYRNK